MRIAHEALTWLQFRPLDEEGYMIGADPDVLGALTKLDGLSNDEDRRDVESHLPGGLSILGIFSNSGSASSSSDVLYTCIRSSSEVMLMDKQGEQVAYEPIEAEEMLKDYVILRCHWMSHAAIKENDPPPEFHNAYLACSSTAKGGSGLGLLPVPLSSSSSSSFEDMIVTQRQKSSNSAAASQREANGSQQQQKKKKGGKGRGGRSLPGEGATSTKAVTLDDLVRETSIGPLLDISILSKRAPAPLDHAPIALIDPPSPPPSSSTNPLSPPSLHLLRRENEVLVYIHRRQSFHQASSHVLHALNRQQQQQQAAISRQSQMVVSPSTATADSSLTYEVVTYHSYPGLGRSGCYFPLSITLGFQMKRLEEKGGWIRVPDQEEDGPTFRTLRQSFHQRLGLPLNRPTFRSTNAIQLAPSPPPSPADEGRLKDVHIGLPPSGIVGGKQHLVDGSYLYYHYMQDRFDDRGWGCAYRSLQTIVSFFRLTNYTTKPVPSHEDIQQLLVNIGDKPPSFVGSKEWIGSMEVGYYLDNVLGITWRNLMADTGPQVAEKARELATHFDTHGTPVMMGGGHLALTILGIDWNERTGDIKFLILDPHYTGSEDLQVIQGKEHMLEGYRATSCGWRSASTFARGSFHQLCLPARPNCY